MTLLHGICPVCVSKTRFSWAREADILALACDDCGAQIPLRRIHSDLDLTQWKAPDAVEEFFQVLMMVQDRPS
ncbi:MAG: hypothetical protein M5R36_18705 [Deltaproteobacteria bacterium]|nr:hypothetical protein [Deltaproteobacteria bacterium]